MYKIPSKVDFYITNVCNLTCENCNRFNNFNFKGWQDWKEYGPIYEQWGKLVELTSITIMGGEPFLNPTLKDWISGLNRIFGIEVQVLTNGTRFLQNPDVYEAFASYKSRKNQDAKNHIGVSLHTPENFEQMREEIHTFLQGRVKEYSKEETPWNADWHFEDSRGVIVNVYTVDHFFNSSIIPLGDGKFTLHNNNVDHAHSNCAFAQWKSYHFIRGKFYKCGPSALMPEFDKQYHFDISEEDRTLLHSYRPLTVENFNEYHEEFFVNLDKPLPQCKFCSVESGVKKIYPVRKGLK